MIFLHNGGGFHGIWHKQIEYFKKQHTCYGVDLMGFGDSPTLGDSHALHQHYIHIRNLIESENIQRPVLIGNCIGASIALYYANKHPDKVQSVILFNICPGINIYKSLIGKSIHEAVIKNPLVKDWVRNKLIKAMGGKREKKRIPGLLFGKYPDVNSPLFKKLKELYITDKQKDSRCNLLFEIHTFTTDEYLKENSHLPPVMMVWGDHNKIVSLQEGLRLKEIIQPERFYIIREGGHLLMYEKSEKVNKMIESFLNTKHLT